MSVRSSVSAWSSKLLLAGTAILPAAAVNIASPVTAFAIGSQPDAIFVDSSHNPGCVSEGIGYTIIVQSLTGNGTPSGTVTLTDNGTTVATVTLNSFGTALIGEVYAAPGAHAIAVTYSGDATFAPGVGTLPTEVIVPCGTFPTNTGATFVVGDLEEGLGNTVTWWSSQWAKINLMSNGSPPSSMKGFAGFEDMPLPSPLPSPSSLCGTSFTTDTGNSTPPPASVPTDMFVIVSSHVTQAGSVISGNIKKLIVVHNNPGYAPDPGHQGTGTETAIVCSSP